MSAKAKIKPKIREAALSKTKTATKVNVNVEVNGFLLIYSKSGRGFWVNGDTYSMRSDFKRMGGEWNPYREGWYYRISKNDELIDFLESSKKATKDLTIAIVKDSEVFQVVGNTYPYRRKMRDLGGSWNKDTKTWVFPNRCISEVQAFIQ